ncbi:MAG TPA: hypothetical protein VGG11_01795 [Xanthobacteraceae bacterium]
MRANSPIKFANEASSGVKSAGRTAQAGDPAVFCAVFYLSQSSTNAHRLGLLIEPIVNVLPHRVLGETVTLFLAFGLLSVTFECVQIRCISLRCFRLSRPQPHRVRRGSENFANLGNGTADCSSGWLSHERTFRTVGGLMLPTVPTIYTIEDDLYD